MRWIFVNSAQGKWNCIGSQLCIYSFKIYTKKRFLFIYLSPLGSHKNINLRYKNLSQNKHFKMQFINSGKQGVNLINLWSPYKYNLASGPWKGLMECTSIAPNLVRCLQTITEGKDHSHTSFSVEILILNKEFPLAFREPGMCSQYSGGPIR